MLVLSRKIGEEIVIDGRIRIRLLGFTSKAARLGFVADNDVIILRDEIFDHSFTRCVEDSVTVGGQPSSAG